MCTDYLHWTYLCVKFETNQTKLSFLHRGRANPWHIWQFPALWDWNINDAQGQGCSQSAQQHWTVQQSGFSLLGSWTGFVLHPSALWKGVVLGLPGLLHHWVSVVKGGGADRREKENPMSSLKLSLVCWLEVAHLSLMGLTGFSGLDICVSKVRLFLTLAGPNSIPVTAFPFSYFPCLCWILWAVL